MEKLFFIFVILASTANVGETTDLSPRVGARRSKPIPKKRRPNRRFLPIRIKTLPIPRVTRQITLNLQLLRNIEMRHFWRVYSHFNDIRRRKKQFLVFWWLWLCLLCFRILEPYDAGFGDVHMLFIAGDYRCFSDLVSAPILVFAGLLIRLSD